MKKIIILAFLLFSITITYGQYDWTKGKLILKKGDTLKGLIKLPIISKNFIVFNGKEKVKFKEHRKSKKVKYDENQIKRIVFNYSDHETAYYEYINTSKSKKGIFKIVVEGKATLYGRNVSISSATPVFAGQGGAFYHSS